MMGDIFPSTRPRLISLVLGIVCWDVVSVVLVRNDKWDPRPRWDLEGVEDVDGEVNCVAIGGVVGDGGISAALVTTDVLANVKFDRDCDRLHGLCKV